MTAPPTESVEHEADDKKHEEEDGETRTPDAVRAWRLRNRSSFSRRMLPSL